jgi:acyl carrier protein
MNSLAHVNGGALSLRYRITQIISEQIGKRIEEPRILDTTEFYRDLEFDSLDRVTMVFAIEDQLGVHITEDEEERLVTVRDLISLVERKLNVMIPA